jgi:hypothetical protein
MNIEIVIVVVVPLLGVMIPFLSLILWVRLALTEALYLHLHKQVSPVKTLKGLAFHTHFNHAQPKKPKETECMLMLKKDTEHCNQLGFLNTFVWISVSMYFQKFYFILSFIE